ncbi:hypothetical protein [Candidatus Magnetobacterium casense]|uniref:Uncharacterized protein n=1 Tax=Candidatus Magnetobacterium casense TaxID=1455061 RepID=A0ABS6S3X8_9BACT|nr:hypothetical protein [Candidatus Magnetobacterium casensis]MBV6343557.1 hypothetical protein [Candidatus Magnetobacterium casensis]
MDTCDWCGGDSYLLDGSTPLEQMVLAMLSKPNRHTRKPKGKRKARKIDKREAVEIQPIVPPSRARDSRIDYGELYHSGMEAAPHPRERRVTMPPSRPSSAASPRNRREDEINSTFYEAMRAAQSSRASLGAGPVERTWNIGRPAPTGRDRPSRVESGVDLIFGESIADNTPRTSATVSSVVDEWAEMLVDGDPFFDPDGGGSDVI